MRQNRFSDIFPALAERSSLAAISRLGFTNIPLRRHLNSLFSNPYGVPGAFLADPTFEATFGWSRAEQRMDELESGLLSPELVSVMDKPVAELASDYRFARNQRPYEHQLAAWELLAKPDPQSIVVASGTGSGKTECFMVPILDQLIRARAEQAGRLIGVRALFLYPLNALINSQQERLRAWTEEFNGDIRFCLYNGNTPEKLPAKTIRKALSEVMDRESLRGSPPPILVTNTTMLEYMLVRTSDAPIINQSKGKLEWIVLDEAHTYVGSRAAEVALLLRRVMLAFDVSPEQVRFIATSATIGDPEGEAGLQLRQFLAEVAGVEIERVHLVSGRREIPDLSSINPESKVSIDEIIAIDPEKETSSRRYDALTKSVTARGIRELFTIGDNAAPVARLSEVCTKLFGKKNAYSCEQQGEVLRWLDLVTGTRDNTGEGEGDGEIYLPLRTHLFHQTLSGLWACADKKCQFRRNTKLDSESWPFGQLFLEPRKHCDCGSPAYEVRACDECGEVYLIAGENTGVLVHLEPVSALDEFELEIEPDQDEEGTDVEDQEIDAGSRQNAVLIANRFTNGVGHLHIDRQSRQYVDPSDEALEIIVQEDDGNGLVCPSCRQHDRQGQSIFRFCRLGAPFLIGGIYPTLLEHAPDGEKPADHPCRGRRILTFNDSRQGTARMAAKLQQDAERNRVRGLLYHLALQEGTTIATHKSQALSEEIQQWTSAIEPGLPDSTRHMIESKIQDLKEQEAALSVPKPVLFDTLAQLLCSQGRDFDYMFTHYRRIAPDTFGEAQGPLELAKMFMIREFGRRPKRLNNLESMGLVAVRYPSLEKITKVPDIVKDASGFNLEEWRAFLKISLDFFIRGGGSLEFPLSWRKWLGMPFPLSQLVHRDEESVGRGRRRWPRARRSGLQSTLVRLLSCLLKLDLDDPLGEDKIDAILGMAWDVLCSMGSLRQTADGWVLPLKEVAFSPMDHAYICPVTRRFLDTTLDGVTPYLPRNLSSDSTICERVELPLYPRPFSGVTDDQERIHIAREWIMNNAVIQELREQGLWSDLNDRTIELSPYYSAAEHSAQQESKILRRYEKEFKRGDINLLSCSTTMEMGIDIGGISQVAMSNVPPHPANYLQRTGRAGRRGEARSVGLTLCKSNPHDQSVFRNSRWAFDTPLPAPRVGLDSRIIIQRHIQAFLLSHFLAETLAASGQEQIKLKCGAFFVGDESLVLKYIAWCNGDTLHQKTRIKDALRKLLRHSVLEGIQLRRLTAAAAQSMTVVMSSWLQEYELLSSDMEEISQSAGENSPAYRAVNFRKMRLTDEYLLRELAARGYLPAHGFPTDISSFDNLTRQQFIRKKQKDEDGREDNRYRRRELASRDLTTALREYAPGAEVVIDGLVYRSSGVTLNWHIPADQQNAREIQNIRLAWRCQACGASGSSHSIESANHCDACGSAIEAINIREFLQPAGFSVDFLQEPTNDITRQHFVPVEQPWIDTGGPWYPLPNPALGRFRVSTNGHVFNQSRGIHGNGYALCLECGRAEPMVVDDELPKVFQEPHRKLRRTNGDDGYCGGSEESWKLKRGITLGHESWTDVFEIQIKTESGIWLNDGSAAATIAVALRDALANIIGVQSSELGCYIKPSRVDSTTTTSSMIVYDRYAAGYASSAEKYFGDLFAAARHGLRCPANCDSACPQCVLDFDQRFMADRLNRHTALEVLTDNWLAQFQLPEELSYFGKASRPEYRDITESIWYEIARSNITGVRLYAGGDALFWDVGPSPLREFAYRLSANDMQVEIVLSEKNLSELAEEDRYLLASIADHPRIGISTINTPMKSGKGWLVAEAIGKKCHCWAVATESSLIFGPEWGQTDGHLITAVQPTLPINNTEVLSASVLRPQASDKGDKEIEIHRELDGPIQGFGGRFWQHITGLHTSVGEVLLNGKEVIEFISYRDRYLFTPVSIALLLELISGLRDTIDNNRWAVETVNVNTMKVRNMGRNKARNNVWSDWTNPKLRDHVFEETFEYYGFSLNIEVGDSANTGHSRILEILMSSGKVITFRFDHGVTYWRAAEENPRHVIYFDLNSTDAKTQGERLASVRP